MTELAGRRFGAWTVVRTDATFKRAVVACTCGAIATVAVEALVSGESRGCGCRGTPRTLIASSTSTFATELTQLESRGGSQRHRGGGIS